MYRTARKEHVQVSSVNAHQVCDSDNEPQDQTSSLGLVFTVMVRVGYSHTFGLCAVDLRFSVQFSFETVCCQPRMAHNKALIRYSNKIDKRMIYL